jgi:glycosyltransferase involved in cell wall biosynthesis
MSVYLQTDATELLKCLESIDEQSLAPSQLVVVIDGPVQEGVKYVLQSYKFDSDYPVEIIKFSQNRGLGAALADGLKACRHDLVARADTDDINLPSRFEIQHRYLMQSPELSVVGGLLEEVYKDSKGSRSLIRSVPVDAKSIAKTSRYRNPINHPTAMFRRKDILQAGSYRSIIWFEDYHLWARLIMDGFSLGNVNQVLVRVSADNEYFHRRGGIRYLRQELVLASEFRKIGFHNGWQSARFIFSRFIFRVVPVKIRSWLYYKVLRNPNSNTDQS